MSVYTFKNNKADTKNCNDKTINFLLKHHLPPFFDRQTINFAHLVLYNFCHSILINNFNMQALRSIPKILDSIEDIKKIDNSEEALKQYKKSVKVFIKTLTQEVGTLIDKYQREIASLTEENMKLKRRPSPLKEIDTKRKRSKSPFKISDEVASPIKIFKGLDMMQTAKSTMFNPHKMGDMNQGARFSSVLAKYQSNDDDNNFPIELINHDPGQQNNRKSRFAVKGNIKKQREEQLCHFLQTGKKNFKTTTDRFLSAIGRAQAQEECPQHQLKKQGSDSSLSFRRNQSNNKSLGDICQSMNNSFYSRKAKSQNKNKRSKQIQEAQKKKQRDDELNKMLKNKGIKNLLMRLRDNVENSATGVQEVIKTSKLISSGPIKQSSPPKKQAQNVQSPSLAKRASKVLINPVPVDIGKKSQLMRRDSASPLSPQKKPTSILKQSSSVLTRSLSGISAIQFQ